MFFLTGLFGVDKHKLFAFFVKKKNKKICHIKKCLYICSVIVRWYMFGFMCRILVAETL